MRSLSAVFLVLFLLAGPARADESFPPALVQSIKAAAVFVKVKVEDRSGSGSGFVAKTEADTAYVVTNHHVIEPKLVEVLMVPDRPSRGPRHSIGPHYPPSHSNPRLLPPGYSPRVIVHSFKNAAVTVVFASGTEEEQSLSAQVLAADPEHDLAVLKVSGVKKPPQPIDYLQESELTETMPVYTFGFPFGEVLATSKGNPAITVGKASISSLRRNDAGELALVQIDGALNPGNSGGPMVDVHGRLVGVAVATIRNSSGIGLGIPARELARMIQGRLGKVHLQAAQDGDGPVTIRVEAALVDPFHKIQSVSLHYLDASRLADPPKPALPIDSLPGCHTLALTIEEQMAVRADPAQERHDASDHLAPGRLCHRGRQGVRRQEPRGDGQSEGRGTASRGQGSASRGRRGIGRDGEATGLPAPAAERSREVASRARDALGRRSRRHCRRSQFGSNGPADQRHPEAGRHQTAAAAPRRDQGPGKSNAGGRPCLPPLARRRAIEDLGHAREHSGAEEGLRDSEPYVRDCAKAAIEQINSAAGAEAGSSEKDAGGQGYSSGSPKPRADSESPGLDDLDLLLADLKSSQIGRRMHALLQLKRAKPKEPNPEVAKALETVLLEDGSSNMRVSAAIALKLWGTRENIPALKKAIEDGESSVRHWAQKTLETIESLPKK